MNNIDQLLYNMAKLANSDISIDQGIVYTIGQQTIFYFSFLGNLDKKEDYYSPELQQKLSNLKKYSLVIADFSYERFDHFTLYDAFEELGINFIILNHKLPNHQIRPKCLYYPNLYHWLRVNNAPTHRLQSTDRRKYKVSCLNNVPRWHRVYNYVLLQSHPDVETFRISMRQRRTEPSDADYPELLTKNSMPDEIIQQWNAIQNNLPESKPQHRFNPGIDIKDPAYTDSYINLVTETDVSNNMFITEKTWKPIANAQLFLIVGYKNIISHLRILGVDTFDDIVDHDYYDQESDWQIRIQKIHQVINNLLTQDLESIYANTQQRRMANAEKFFNGKFGIKYQQDFLNLLTQ
jgi:hypothetical protein